MSVEKTPTPTEARKFLFKNAPDNIKDHVVNFSGGRTSAYLVHLMEEKRKRLGWRVHYVFMDTGAEADETYQFVRDVVEHFGIEITCIKAHIPAELGKGPEPVVVPLEECKWDLTVWRQMLAAYSTPFYPGGGFCTDRMKSEIYRKYCDRRFGRYNYHTWLGMRVDEPTRIKESKDRRKFGIRYLAEISDFEKADVLAWWRKMPFDLELEEWLGNCIFCIKKGINKIALAIKDRPERATEFWEMINEAGVRDLERDFPPQIMYRGHNSLQTIKEIYSEVDRQELIDRLRGEKRDAAGNCSESCEAF